MKSVFYAGAALMLAAGIYGFVDYKKSNRNEEVKSMFKEKEEVQANSPEDQDPVVEVEAATMKEQEEAATKKSGDSKVREKNKRGAKDQNVGEEKELTLEHFSRAPLKEVPKVRISEKREKSSDSKKGE